MALTSAGTQSFTKPSRIEGHTSNVEAVIYYTQFGTVAPASVDAAGGFYLQHKFSNLAYVTLTPTNAAGATCLYGANAATDGAHVATANAIPEETVGASALLGASTLTLGSGSSEIADVHNGAWIDIRFASGNIQTVQITDFAVTSNIATLADVLVEAVAATDTYRMRGSLVTTVSAATTPTFICQAIGTFEG